MKKMKKLFAVLLTLAMVFGMSMTSFAATKTSATITVNNAEDATLTYAQVIKADRTTRTGWAFVSDDVAQAYIDAFEVADAQAAIDAMTQTEVDAAKLGKAQAEAAKLLTFEDLPDSVNEAGVYLIKAVEEGYTYNIMAAYVGFGVVKIDGTTYEYPSLMDAELTAKKTETTVIKTVADSDNVTKTGDTLTYTVKANVPFINPTDSDKTFWVYDELTGATYKDLLTTATIKLDGSNVKADYTITQNDDKTSFSIDLSKMIDDANSNAGKEGEITYEVTVTSENDTITNKATAGHKDSSDFGSTTITTYEGNITLTKSNENGKVLLADAGFEVRKDSADSEALTFTKLADGVYKYDPKGTVTKVVTKADGTVKVQGLDVGTYFFKEVEAPKGYSVNTENATATLEVGEDGKASAVLTATTQMHDTKLSSLPSTGGIGTTIFTIAGCVIMIAAAGLFFASRKKSDNK